LAHAPVVGSFDIDLSGSTRNPADTDGYAYSPRGAAADAAALASAHYQHCRAFFAASSRTRCVASAPDDDDNDDLLGHGGGGLCGSVGNWAREAEQDAPWAITRIQTTFRGELMRHALACARARARRLADAGLLTPQLRRPAAAAAR
jgi:hypothetical protein